MQKVSHGDPEKYQNFYFEFTGGSINAANYLVEHNEDKKRVRFTLQGNTEADLRVTSKEGLDYVQAGGTCYLPVEENPDIQIPYYKIIAYEKLNKTSAGSASEELNRQVDLGNGYINVNNTLAANVSNYSTSFIFSKSNLNYPTAYNITSEQISKAATFAYDYWKAGSLKFDGSEDIVKIKYWAASGQYSVKEVEEVYVLTGPVRVIYSFEGTNSDLNSSDGEQKASGLEELISKIFIAVGDMAINVTDLGGTKQANNGANTDNKAMYVTLDSLVFNEYPKTIVDLWGDTGSTNTYAKKVVNFWYKVFQAWALMLYILLLVYIGIKTILHTGTPEQKKIKPMIEGWLIGVLMLFCLPFLFKYLIEINDVFVDIIRVNSKYSVYAYYTFEDVYKDLGIGDKEDGEDSTTDIVVRLENAKDKLVATIEELERDVSAFADGYQEALDDVKKYEDNYEKVQMAVEQNLKDTEKLYSDMGYEFQKNGVKVSFNQITDGMWDLVDKYYAENVNFDGTDFSEEFDEGLEELAKQYADNFIVYDPTTGEEAKHPTGLQQNGVNWFTAQLRKDIESTIVGGTQIFNYDQNGNIVDEYGNIISEDDLIEARSINDVYEAKEWTKYYQMEVKNKEDELAKNQETLYGLEKAIERAEDNELDIIGEMRSRAGETLRIFYVLIWLILVFQLILLLVLYYKRLFMIAILVAIFPLVTVAYVFEKAQGAKSNILKNWITEFTLNVFIQSVHAIIYVTLIEIGYAVYLGNNDSWIIFLLSVFALITVEPIFRHILGLKGSTVSTLGDYSKVALGTVVAVGAVGSTIVHTRKDLKNISNDSKNKAAKSEKKDAEKDKRAETRRKERENLLKGNSRLSKAARFLNKSKVLNGIGTIYGKTTATGRKVYRSVRNGSRKHLTRLRMAKRIMTNIGAVGGTIAGGFATGGTPDDFVKAASVANALSGTNKDIKLSDDALVKEDDKVNAKNEIGEVSAEGEGNTRRPTYSGSSYDDYNEYGSGNYNGEGVDEEKPKGNPLLKLAFVQKIEENRHMKGRARLEEQKAYSEENWNINYEEDN